MKQIKVIVDRQTWYRGKGPATSSLLRRDGQRCCIGFLGKTLGLKDPEMRYRATMRDVTIHGCKTETASEFEYAHADTLVEAYDVNDSKDFTEKQREGQLKKLGKAMGVRFEFIN
jgi:hypothetical protein